MRIDEIEDYCELVLKSSDAIEIEITFKILLTYYKCSSIKLSRESTFWRARNLEGRALFNNIADLSYPPKNLTKSGRMNEANEPMFYLATRKETALAEIGIKEMEFVQVAGFRIANAKELAVSIVGMFWSVFKNGSVPLILKDPNQQIFICTQAIGSAHFVKSDEYYSIFMPGQVRLVSFYRSISRKYILLNSLNQHRGMAS